MHAYTCIHTHTHEPGSARPTAAGAELRRGGGAIHVAVVARITAAAAAVPRLLPNPMQCPRGRETEDAEHIHQLGIVAAVASV
jgi:hypothetical protein